MVKNNSYLKQSRLHRRHHRILFDILGMNIDHFEPSSWFIANKNRTNLKADAVPTLGLTNGWYNLLYLF